MKTTRAIAGVAVCLLALFMAQAVAAQATAPPLLNGTVAGENNPNNLSSYCNFIGLCAQQFGVGSPGAYINGVGLGLFGVNENGSVSCGFTITDGLVPNGLGNILLQRQEST